MPTGAISSVVPVGPVVSSVFIVSLAEVSETFSETDSDILPLFALLPQAIKAPVITKVIINAAILFIIIHPFIASYFLISFSCLNLVLPDRHFFIQIYVHKIYDIDKKTLWIIFVLLKILTILTHCNKLSCC